MPRSKVIDSLWREAASIFECLVQNTEDESRLPTESELRNHLESLQDLVDIFADASSSGPDKQPPQFAYQTNTSCTIASISASEQSFNWNAKPDRKRKFVEPSSRTSNIKSASVPIQPQHPTPTFDEDQYIWNKYQQSVANGDKCPSDKKSPRGMCTEIAEKLKTTRQAVAIRLQQTKVTHAQAKVSTHGYWSDSDDPSSVAELPGAKTPVLLGRRGTFTTSEDDQIWNAYICNGCDVKPVSAYERLLIDLTNHDTKSVYHRLLMLVSADQGVLKSESEPCLFSPEEDQHILTAYRHNQHLSHHNQLHEHAWSSMLSKVLHREPVRVMYRARKLIAERALEDSFLQWEQRARDAPKATTACSNSSWPYTAEELQLLAELDQSDRTATEKLSILRYVAKGLGRTFDAVKHHIRKIRRDQHDDPEVSCVNKSASRGTEGGKG